MMGSNNINVKMQTASLKVVPILFLFISGLASATIISQSDTMTQAFTPNYQASWFTYDDGAG
jgi:hypothetical protein